MNAFNTQKTSSQVRAMLKALHRSPAQYWERRGERFVLRLFKAMSRRVPAYKDFLKKHKIRPEKINTIQDLQHLPSISKDAYLKKYPRELLCWDGTLAGGQLTFSLTSGSTGEPFYFPRTETQDLQYALTAELYLLENFQIHKKSTLYIVGFPMGAWIGGVFTYEALTTIARRGKYKLSVITPGIHKAEIIRAVANLGPYFDQVIIGSYGPFLKDVLDEGIRQGMNWKQYNIGLIFSAEGFSEEFRDYCAKHMGIKNMYQRTLNHYGTVDLGTMSHETPAAIYLRRLALGNPELYTQLFGQTRKLPTLTQYLPEMFYFEAMGNSLLCSANSGIPLVRYDLKDNGGIVRYDDAALLAHEYSTTQVGVPGATWQQLQPWQLPFVYVYERSDFSVSLFAFQIYPETVRKALQKPPFTTKLTGKFSMEVSFNKQNNQYLRIHIETKPGFKGTKSLTRKLQHALVIQLCQDSSEYKKTFSLYPKQLIPRITYWPYEHPAYFKPGTKQQWVLKKR